MGAEFNFMVIEKEMSEDELKEKWAEIKEKAEYDHGHSGYTGSFAEKNDIEIIETEKPMEEKEAEKFIMNNNDKWGDASAIKLNNGKWCIGGWCSS
jgi:hypothetical protein